MFVLCNNHSATPANTATTHWPPIQAWTCKICYEDFATIIEYEEPYAPLLINLIFPGTTPAA